MLPFLHLASSKVYWNAYVYNPFAVWQVVIHLLPILAGGNATTSLPIYPLPLSFNYLNIGNIIGFREFDIRFE